MSDPDPAQLESILEAEELRERGLGVCVGPPPVVLEIGFGRGELLLELAARFPQRCFLGIERSRKRVLKAAKRIRRQGLANLRLVHAPAEYLLELALPEACIAECWINFSDPWPKKRHHKRRLFQPSFVVRLARVLEPGARLHAATDHLGYAEWIDAVLAAEPWLRNLHAPRPWSECRPERPITAYEAEWLAEGRPIAYFDYLRS